MLFKLPRSRCRDPRTLLMDCMMCCRNSISTFQRKQGGAKGSVADSSDQFRAVCAQAAVSRAGGHDDVVACIGRQTLVSRSEALPVGDSQSGIQRLKIGLVKRGIQLGRGRYKLSICAQPE